MKDLINKKVSDYLTFDINKLLNINGLYIYGGAIRDSISNMKIQDVDILLFDHMEELNTILYDNGYKCNRDELFKKGINEHEVVDTKNKEYYKKIGDDVRRIQIYFDSIENHYPDFTITGLYYSKDGIIEKLEDSILHCKWKVFKRNPKVRMRKYRLEKFLNLGWKYCDENVDRRILRYKKLIKINDRYNK